MTNTAICASLMLSFGQYLSGTSWQAWVISCSFRRSMAGRNASEKLTSVNGAAIVVGSLAVAVAAPPPDTLTLFVTVDAALADTLTVMVMGGYWLPAGRTSARRHVNVDRVQSHPGPPIAVGARSVGKMSVTKTEPLVEADPAFWIEIEYPAVLCPCKKL